MARVHHPDELRQRRRARAPHLPAGFDPVTSDQAGVPYLCFYNHKAARDAVIPISERVLEAIGSQQEWLRERWPTGARAWLFPRPWRNADGLYPLAGQTLNRRLKRWLADLDVRDAQGESVKVTAHQFRHTLGTRMINNEVSQPTVQRLLDHSSPAMTARYAHIKDQTLRREWERYQERVYIRGEAIVLDPDGPHSDAAWALENLARAKQTLPNGYCGLPLQQRCPHPNACLTCARSRRVGTPHGWRRSAAIRTRGHARAGGTAGSATPSGRRPRSARASH